MSLAVAPLARTALLPRRVLPGDDAADVRAQFEEQGYLHARGILSAGLVRTSIDSRWFGDDTATSRQYVDLATRRVVQMF